MRVQRARIQGWREDRIVDDVDGFRPIFRPERQHPLEISDEWSAPCAINLGMPSPYDILQDLRVIFPLEGVIEHHQLEEHAA